MDYLPVLDAPLSTYVWAFNAKQHDWNICRLLSSNNDVVTVFDKKKNITFNLKKSLICVVDPTHLQDLSDLAAMNNLHEAPLTNILRSRWSKNTIYTLAGDVLISVNPYKLIAGAYDNPQEYFNISPTSSLEEIQYEESLSGLPPHVFMIANRALRYLTSEYSLIEGLKNQSVIISGESGSGKTEASKYVINFLVQANQLLIQSPRYQSIFNNAVDNIYTPRIKDLILDSNIIFEAFGNAKTVRNDNSSRFGKYIKLQYSESSELVSASTETFLLEQSRLISVGENERNYHVFYQMLRGLKIINEDLFNELHLSDVNSFKILTMGHCTYANLHVDDASEFQALYQALFSLGCEDQLLLSLWKIIASILHLGNAVVHEAVGYDAHCKITIPGASIDLIADMLGVDSQEFLSKLVSTTLTSGTKVSIYHTKPLSALESVHNINAVMKWLYVQVFSWLVTMVNKTHSKLVDNIELQSSTMKFIGILDIFGFEILGTNSFEQLCINYTNERLQQQFNDYVFKAEQAVYAQEGLDWESIAFSDNQCIIDLISKKPTGLLPVLEEFGLMNREPNDEALLSTYYQHHDQNSSFIKSRFNGEGFSIKHFAGVVQYKIEGFISKNNNSLQEDLNELLESSENEMLKQVHDMYTSQTGRDIVFLSNSPAIMRRQSLKRQSSRRLSATVTVSLQFRQQLDHLIGTLSETRPHYIKCIKPNDNKQHSAFNWPVVASQLRSCGVLEVVRIRREGYPIRLTFEAFYEKYFLSRTLFRRLYPDWKTNISKCSIEELKQYCHAILKRALKPKSYQIGLSFICLHENGFLELDKSMDVMYNHYIIIIQRVFRGRRVYQAYQSLRAGIIKFQSRVRGQQIRKRYSKYYGNISDLRNRILEWCDSKLQTWNAIIRDHYLVEIEDVEDDSNINAKSSMDDYIPVPTLSHTASEENVQDISSELFSLPPSADESPKSTHRFDFQESNELSITEVSMKNPPNFDIPNNLDKVAGKDVKGPVVIEIVPEKILQKQRASATKAEQNANSITGTTKKSLSSTSSPKPKVAATGPKPKAFEETPNFRKLPTSSSKTPQKRSVSPKLAPLVVDPMNEGPSMVTSLRPSQLASTRISLPSKQSNSPVLPFKQQQPSVPSLGRTLSTSKLSKQQISQTIQNTKQSELRSTSTPSSHPVNLSSPINQLRKGLATKPMVRPMQVETSLKARASSRNGAPSPSPSATASVTASVSSLSARSTDHGFTRKKVRAAT